MPYKIGVNDPGREVSKEESGSHLILLMKGK
jgi:hypothetical protein